ncbi:hypothetical protein G6O67_004494 [Ophiocordyceps sinensis]|uniref:Uncharacterized protein n=1 Tax=Ophiocordyceps sinensis TaxID=72228 RepID=A0A8H4PPJ0_9HYPO|nr:hypothetical protein G6O67_004494 [Ophiocordyceps sinensis]
MGSLERVVDALYFVAQLEHPRVTKGQGRAVLLVERHDVPRAAVLGVADFQLEAGGAPHRVLELLLELGDARLLGRQRLAVRLLPGLVRPLDGLGVLLHALNELLQLSNVARVACHGAVEPLIAHPQLLDHGVLFAEDALGLVHLELEPLNDGDAGVELLAQRLFNLVVLVDGGFVFLHLFGEDTEATEQQIEHLCPVRAERQDKLSGSEILELEPGGAEAGGQGCDHVARVTARESNVGDGGRQVSQRRGAVRHGLHQTLDLPLQSLNARRRSNGRRHHRRQAIGDALAQALVRLERRR